MAMSYCPVHAEFAPATAMLVEGDASLAEVYASFAAE